MVGTGYRYRYISENQIRVCDKFPDVFFAKNNFLYEKKMAKYTVSGHAGYIYDSLLLAGYPVGRIKAKSESGANIVQT